MFAVNQWNGMHCMVYFCDITYFEITYTHYTTNIYSNALPGIIMCVLVCNKWKTFCSLLNVNKCKMELPACPTKDYN